jgi:hypothetical protein
LCIEEFTLGREPVLFGLSIGEAICSPRSHKRAHEYAPSRSDPLGHVLPFDPSAGYDRLLVSQTLWRPRVRHTGLVPARHVPSLSLGVESSAFVGIEIP